MSRPPTNLFVAALGLIVLSASWIAGNPRPSFAAAQAPATRAPTAAAPRPVPLARGPEADFNLVFSAQVAGWIEPCG